ncbi:MAG: hypothetical protein AAGN35_18680 [Bacteroidota bacterium]
MKLNQLICFLSAILLFGLYPQVGHGQNPAAGTSGTYCNVFYITSDAPEVLPFDDACFVVEEYEISDPKRFRTFGPVKGSIDLFGHFDWAMNFFLPKVNERDRLKIVTPRDFLDRNLKVNDGEFFITLTDNRRSSRFDPVPNNVDFIAVSGTGRVTSFRAQAGDMPYDEYDLQIDVRMQKVDRSGDYPRLSGDPVRLRMALVVEVLQ